MPEADAIVALGTAPCREQGQSVVKGDSAAIYIPRYGSIGGARASLHCVRTIKKCETGRELMDIRRVLDL